MANRYEFNLTNYLQPPQDSSTLIELKQLCNERLQLYKIMDEANILCYKPNSMKWEKYVELEVIRRKLSTYSILLHRGEPIVGQIRARRNDHIAHWLLSLCYCHSKCLRAFFINCELYWFTMLYKRMQSEDLKEFFIKSGFKFNCICDEEKIRLKDKLLMCSKFNNNSDFNTIKYYKIEFKDAFNLAAARKVLVSKGFAYIPETDLISCIKVTLWRHFNQQLEWMNAMYPTNIKEERLETFLRNIPVVMPTHKTFSDKTIPLNLKNIDEMATLHFPLCMKTIHSVLRKEHHLKYDCKMQYGIFLKWVGMSYQHAMELWKSEFTHKMSEDWFNRKYSYLFKHQYGKVGNMVDYNRRTCEEIIRKYPGPGQHHGCPFKHWDLQRLINKCEEDGFTTEDTRILKELVIGNKCREACALYFGVTHTAYIKHVTTSPNEYVEASYEFENSLGNCLNLIVDDCL